MRAVRVALVACALLALIAPATHASFPGQNGKILVLVVKSGGGDDLWSINPDGSAPVNLTNTPDVTERGGSWSPDGTKIAFVTGEQVWTMNADGSNRTNVTPDVSGPPFYNAHVSAVDVAWSPDGTRIAFTDAEPCGANRGPGHLMLIDPDGSNPTRVVCQWPFLPGGTVKGYAAGGVSWSPDGSKLTFDGPASPVCEPDVWTVNVDGTAITDITNDPGDEGSPDWSPAGSRIALVYGGCIDPQKLWMINPDGTGKTLVTSAANGSPVWSPDGTRLAVSAGGSVHTINPDGTGDVVIMNTPVLAYPQSWLAIPQNAYVRPKGATPFYGSLTIAYKPCTSPDRTHGPPLAYGSCSSPQMTSDYLTVGTADANGNPPRNEGYLRMGVVAGIPGGVDDADVTLEFFSDDVFTKAIADYTGELRAKVALQITDKDNTPNPGGPGAATPTSIPLELTVGCTPVADPLEGSSCTATTSADALAPGTVKEGRRSIWGLGRVEVYDGGADGDAQTPAGDTLFQTQGLFIP